MNGVCVNLSRVNLRTKDSSDRLAVKTLSIAGSKSYRSYHFVDLKVCKTAEQLGEQVPPSVCAC